MKYEVPIVYRGQSNYIVEAGTKEEAEQIARALWDGGEHPTPLGATDWETIERVGTIEELP